MTGGSFMLSVRACTPPSRAGARYLARPRPAVHVRVPVLCAIRHVCERVTGVSAKEPPASVRAGALERSLVHYT